NLKFKGAKGFKIFSVSLDQNAAAWKGAISSDGLIWPDHVSDLKGWQSAAAGLYGVNSIPTNFLIDPKGVIVAHGLRGDALGDKLSELVQ
ncbi:MAG TPA: thioredoxin family protein, partial [Bacteroidia bacterium]|nr:thioredoxin family protein [Bacteroidia bacterium]